MSDGEKRIGHFNRSVRFLPRRFASSRLRAVEKRGRLAKDAAPIIGRR